MFLILKHRESLEWAFDGIENGREYQALDVINKHIKEIIENTKPNVERALDTTNRYLDDLQETIILLEQAIKTSGESELKLKKDAQEKINSAIKRIGTINECCKIMDRHKKNLQ